MVRQERNDFLYNYIEIVDGLQFNQYKTIKKIHKYYNSHYESGDYEEINGVTRKKVFYNINKWRADVATKMLDIDVKDFVLTSENPETEFQTYLLEKELKAWLKKHKLGKVLNQIVRNLPIYGSVVLKKVKGGAEVVDLRYLFLDQAAETLQDSRYIIQKHLMTAGELRKMRGIWDNVDEAIDRYCNYTSVGYEDELGYNQPASSPYAEVYERYGEVPKSFITGKDRDNDEYVLAKFIIAGVDITKIDKENKVVYEEGLILYKEQIKDLPFREVHYSKTEGRWLGVGVVEDTFEAQVQVNRLKDSEAKALELASLILFQTRDDLVTRNLLSDADNGDILKVKTEINRIDNTNKAWGDFKNATESYERLADRQTFSYDIIRGEAPPSSATATSVANQVQQAASVFDFKRENIGLFLQEFITDLVFPELKTKLNTPHVFRFSGTKDEMERMRKRVAEAYVRAKMFENGVIPNQQEYDGLVEQAVSAYRKNGDKIWLEINKDYFSNLEYEVTLEITGESKNIAAQLENVSTVLTELARNPALLENPVLKRLLFKQMQLMGMSLVELENAEQELAEASPEKLAAINELAQGRNQGGMSQAGSMMSQMANEQMQE